MRFADSMTCIRCKKVAGCLLGGVCADCVTPEDEERAHPGVGARRAAWNAALAEMSKPHKVPRCEELRRQFNIACPRHDRDEESEEE